MLLVEINFGRCQSTERSSFEEAAEEYLASILHGGQICGEFILTWIKSELVATTQMAGLGAQKRSNHSKWGLRALAGLGKTFGSKPRWTIRDDEKPKVNFSWRGAAELILFTTALDTKSPVCRGDTGAVIPVFLLPVSEEVKNDIVRWQSSYSAHDQIWLGSGSLEITAYTELVTVDSELSKEGRDLCRALEDGTGVPTFYFLMRYFAFPEKEFGRKCPSCGKKWRTNAAEDSKFWEWHFRCDRCRLVANAGVEVDGEFALIGA